MRTLADDGGTELGPGESSWAKARRRDEITRREDFIALPGWDWTGQFRNQDFWLDPEAVLFRWAGLLMGLPAWAAVELFFFFENSAHRGTQIKLF